jgi:hypothetical protein
MLIDAKAKLIAVLDHAEQYRSLAIRAKDRGEREVYERIAVLKGTAPSLDKGAIGGRGRAGHEYEHTSDPRIKPVVLKVVP